MTAPISSPLESAAARLAGAGLAVERGVPLAECGTFRLGGPCGLLVRCRAEETLVAAVRALGDADVPRVVIGGGSNILFSDEGFPGVVLQYWSDPSVVSGLADEAIARDAEGRLSASGAIALDRLAASATEAGLEGLTSLSGIPGTVGGAVAGNAGAWGEQIGDAVERARLLDSRGNIREVAGAELGFAYRKSLLQASGDIVLRVWLRVRPSDAEVLRAHRREILALRAEKHPHLAECPSIGSIFRNIEPTSAAGRRQAAGWFLEQAGAKDFSAGGARLFPKHANIIIKAGPACRAQDVRDLAVRMREAVREKFGLELAREVRFLGSFAGEETRADFF